MRWQGLHVFPIESWFSEALVKSTEALNARIESVLAARREFELKDSVGGQLAQADVIELDFGELLTLHAPRVELARTLQAELGLRDAIMLWLDGEFYPALAAERDEQARLLDGARVKIREALEKLGYHKFQDSTPDPCRWFPGWVEGHPTVHSLRLRYQALASAACGGDDRRQNHQASEEARRLLEKLRDDAVAAANLSV